MAGSLVSKSAPKCQKLTGDADTVCPVVTRLLYLTSVNSIGSSGCFFYIREGESRSPRISLNMCVCGEGGGVGGCQWVCVRVCVRVHAYIA